MLQIGVKTGSGYSILSDIRIQQIENKSGDIRIQTSVEMYMVNIWIFFTKTNTKVILNFEENMDMKMDISLFE
jgi:hypothetical protein